MLLSFLIVLVNAFLDVRLDRGNEGPCKASCKAPNPRSFECRLQRSCGVDLGKQSPYQWDQWFAISFASTYDITFIAVVLRNESAMT